MFKDIAVKLNRTVRACIMKKNKILKKMKADSELSIHSRVNLWTEEEENLLMKLCDNGNELEEIAIKLNRTVQACAMKKNKILKKMKLNEKLKSS